MKGAAQTVIHEALVQIAAAIVAAYLIGQVPELRNWIRTQWGKP